MAATTTRRPVRQRRHADSGKDALRLSREVLRHLPSGVVFFDAAGRVVEANPAARNALGQMHPSGLSVAALLGDAELHDADGSLLGAAAPLVLASCRSLEPLQRKTLHYTTPDGEGRRLGVTLFPLRRGTREPPAGLICLLTDLTAIHAMEEELNRRQSMSALGEMAAGIAHEFRNGLAIISGYAQMLQGDLAEPGWGRVIKILEQAELLNSIATEFLAFARPLPVEVEALDAAALLGQCAEAVRAHDFPQIQFSIEGQIPTVMGDPVLLTAAFLNLLRNACEAIVQGRQGGRVWIRCAGRTPEIVSIDFVDDGPGVAPEAASKIFIPFFTTKASGTGLGLAMVHKIITAHQGSVRLADATPGHTVFEVLLPAAGG
ncbi:MAG: two-component system sensor histidine kinase NtrB [Terriglobales bacterium]